MNQRRINLQATVDSAAIRTVVENNREHIVVPSYTLPDNVVMNGGLYPADEIAKSFQSLEGTLAPLGHPVINGEPAAANEAMAINAYHIGAWNRNVKRVGNRVYLEKWIDVETAKRTANGQKVLDAISKGEQIHTSTGLLCNVEQLNNAAKDDAGVEYNWIARDMVFDHDAILLDEAGAATPAQGVGMLVNLQQTRVFNALASTPMSSGTYGERMRVLGEAVEKQFGGGEDNYTYVQDFDDTHLIYRSKREDTQVSYKIEDGTVTFGNDSKPVRREERWVERETVTVLNRLCQFLGIKVNSDTLKPETASGGKEMDETQVKALISEAVEPLQTKVNTLEADNATLKAANEKLTGELASVTNAQAADKRAVVKEVFGEKIANSAQGEMLEDLYAQAQASGVKGLKTNSAGSEGNQAPDAGYLPEA